MKFTKWKEHQQIKKKLKWTEIEIECIAYAYAY